MLSGLFRGSFLRNSSKNLPVDDWISAVSFMSSHKSGFFN